MQAQLIGWLVVCVSVAWISRKRPAQVLLVTVALYALLPTLASQLLTGIRYDASLGIPALHPATWLLILVAGAQLTRRLNAKAMLEVTWHRRRPWTLAVTVVIAWATLMAAVHRGGYSQVLEILVAPAILSALALSTQTVEPRFSTWMSSTIRWGALGIASFAILQFLTHSDLIYGHFYAEATWSTLYAHLGYRSTTTLGQPLTTTLVLVAAFPLVWHRPLPRIPAWVQRLVLLGGILSTGSRVGLTLVAIFAAVTWWLELRSGHRFSRRSIIVAVLGILATSALLAPLVLQRIATSLGDASAGYRFAGLKAFAEHWGGYVLAGDGPGSSYARGLDWLDDVHGLENPFLQMSVELGILATAVWYAAWAVVALRSRDRRWPWAAPQQSVLLGFLMAASFSSIGAKGSVATLLSMFVALSALALDEPPRSGVQRDPRVVHQGEPVTDDA